MSPKGKGHRSDKHKKSSSSSQPQDEEIPIDPNLTDPSYAGYTQDYAQADPSNYAPWPQQPATVNPNDLWINQDPSSSTVQAYYATGPAYQDAQYDEQPGPSSTAAAQQDYQCEQCDGRTFPGRREYNKHMKIHERPIRCEADKNCKETKAEQRDMDRHYISAHKEYAARKGILTEGFPCDFPGCGKKFTRQDNLLKHWNKYHNPQ